MAANPSAPRKVATSVSARSNAHGKQKFFFIANGLILMLVMLALATNPHARLGIGAYVVLLFTLCSSPILFITNYRGKASLMLMFLAYYFAAFGLLDLSNLISFNPLPPRPAHALFTTGEIVILAGALAFIAGYGLAASFVSERNTGILRKDWSPKAIPAVGIIAWLIGFYTNALVQFGVGDQFTLTDYNLGAFGGFIVLARILSPVGVLMLVYSYLTTGKRSSLIVLIVMMLGDFGLGFVGDTKEMAIRDPLLFLFSYLILRERVPVIITIIFVVAAGIAFNFFAAYRDELGSRHESRVAALSKIDSKLEKILGENKPLTQRFGEGLEYFSSRITLKQNVEIIASRVGKDKEYKNGYTLKPLLYAFIPRFIKPDKQDSSEVGRLFNREFIYAYYGGSPDTYMSVSTIGELYWNFGFAGIIIGMMCIGSLLAYIAGLTLGEKNNLPRYLLLLLTVYLLVLRSESAVAMTYTFWARSVVLLFLIHMLMPKKKAVAGEAAKSNARQTPQILPKTPFLQPRVKS